MARVRCPNCDEMFEVEPVDLDEEELTCNDCGERFALTDEIREELEPADDFDDVAAFDFTGGDDVDGDFETELEQSY